jgi:hypothetical protein
MTVRPSADRAWISSQNSRRALGIDPGGRLVQQQQARLVQHAGRQGQALLPAARETPGQLLLATRQPQPVQGLIHPPAALVQAVDPGREVQVLADRQILVERELLGHVAGLAFDLLGMPPEVQAQHRPLAGVRSEQAAQHAQGGGLARAVGTEKAGDLARAHLDGQVLHHVLVAVRLVEAPHVDGQLSARRIVGEGGGAHLPEPFFPEPFRGTTSMGRPGGRSAGWSGRASTRNTSRSRASRL